MNTALTEVEANVLAFIEEFAAANGLPPTALDIGKSMGISPSNVYNRLRMLEAKGRLRRIHGAARGNIVIHPAPADAPPTVE